MTDQPHEVDLAGSGQTPVSLALVLCGLALNPATGKIGHPTHTGIAVRTALFVELAMAGRLTGSKSPIAAGAAETGSGLPDAVHTAVSAQRRRPWRRWFNHTDADLAAAQQALLAAGASVSASPGLLQVDPEIVAQQRGRLLEFQAGIATPADLAEAVLALLAGGCGIIGRPRPRTELGRVDQWLVPHLAAEPAPAAAAIKAAVTEGLRAMKRSSGLVFWR